MENLNNVIPFIHLLLCIAVVILAIGYSLRSFLNRDISSKQGMPGHAVYYCDGCQNPLKRQDGFTFAMMALVLIMLIVFSLYLIENMPVTPQDLTIK